MPQKQPLRPKRRYECKSALTSKHSDSVNALAFSNRYLATGADDGLAFVFDHDGNEVLKIVCTSAVTAVAWHPQDVSRLFIGSTDGQIRSVSVCDNGPASGYKLSPLPETYEGPMVVESIGIESSGRWMAIAVGAVVIVYTLMGDPTTNSCLEHARISTPPSIIGSEDEPVAPHTVHFIEAQGSPFLLVSYLYHGILCLDLDMAGGVHLPVCWQLVPRSVRIGKSALSPKQNLLLFFNFYDGFDMYSMSEPHGAFQAPRLLRTFRLTITHNMLLQCAFINEGNSVLMGCTNGNVVVDNIVNGAPEVLPHDGDDIVQAVAYHCSGASAYIATGTSEKGEETKIRIWRVEKESGLINRTTKRKTRPRRLRQTTQSESRPGNPLLVGTICVVAALMLFLHLGKASFPWTRITRSTASLLRSSAAYWHGLKLKVGAWVLEVFADDVKAICAFRELVEGLNG
ncbi:hypothetical protein ONZ45_g8126 [Pleurotus djamor]|nr:hypothetical protein ONZ45_g8126 [Pleurotus djamor]